jgi:hypothetical protein
VVVLRAGAAFAKRVICEALGDREVKYAIRSWPLAPKPDALNAFLDRFSTIGRGRGVLQTASENVFSQQLRME